MNDNKYLVDVSITSKILISWMLFLTLALIYNLFREDENSKYFTIGPNNNFIFMGIKIDTISEYLYLILAISINTCIRNLNQDILGPWMIQVIQNEKVLEYSNKIAYEITIVNGIYTWFDYIFNLNLAIIQVDVIIIQILIDMIANIIITKLYLKEKKTINYSKILYSPKIINYQSIV